MFRVPVNEKSTILALVMYPSFVTTAFKIGFDRV